MYVTWKDVLHYFRITPASPEAFYIMLTALLAVILMFTGLEIYMTRKRKRRRLEKEWRFFYRFIEAKDLSFDEMKAVEHLARTFYPKNPQFLVNSVRAFDKAVRSFLANFETWYEDYDREETEELCNEIRDKLFLKDFHAVDDLKTTREIPPGQFIRVTVRSKTMKRFLNTTISDNTKDALILHADAFADMRELFADGLEITGYFWRSGDAGYQFPLRIIGYKDDENIEFEHTDEFTRKQRRHFFRVTTRLKGRFSILTESEKREFLHSGRFDRKDPSEWFPGAVVSLSGGGLSFITEKAVSRGELLAVEVHFRDGAVFSDIIARTVRVKDLVRRNKIFVEFLKVTDSARESIIHYVSLVQLDDKKLLAQKHWNK